MDPTTPQHAHIRTIRHPDITQPSGSPDFFVRKPSFSQETEETLDEEPYFPPLNPQASAILTRNIQGGTFAQRARAAELQAARARRELKQKDINQPSAHETITLKMRSKKKWTPLDLSAVPLSEGESSSQAVNTFPLTEAPPLSSDHQTNLAQPQSDTPNKALPSVPELSFVGTLRTEQTVPMAGPESSMFSTPEQPDIRHALKMRADDDSPTPLGPRVRDKENKQNIDAVTQLPSLTPIPVLTGDNNLSPLWNPEQAQKLIKLQEQQIAELQSQLQRQNLTRQSSEPSTQSVTSQQYNAPSLVTPGLSQVNHRYSPYGQPRPNHQYGDPMKRAYGKHYPAVKGTATALENAARASLTSTLPTARPPGLGGKPQTPRKASEADTTIFLRHLQSIAEKNAKTQALPKEDTKTNPTVNDDEEEELPPLFPDSEPLPWKERRADIVFTRAPVPGAPYFGVPAAVDAYPEYSNQPRYKRYVPNTMADESPEKRILSREEELNDWWTRDNRVTMRTKLMMNDFIEDQNHRSLAQRSMDLDALREANFTDDRDFGVEPEYPKPRGEPAGDDENGEYIRKLLVPVLGNLKSYKSENNSAFNPFGPPPSWAIDHSPSGNDSFFSNNWGIPPQRVGRDPRYRAVQHDGRSSVFEDPTGRWPREEYSYNRSNRW